MDKRHKVSIIGSVGVPACYGGWETLVEYLLPEITESYEVTVYCSSKAYEYRVPEYKNARLKYINLPANGISSIFYDLVSMTKARSEDIQIVLGVSACVFVPIVKIFSKSKIIVAIDGMEWKRAKWNRFAKWFLKLSEKFAVKYADAVISDNEQIRNYVTQFYKSDSYLIEYGADHVNRISFNDEYRSSLDFPSGDYAFKVARIEPENNIKLILEAFSRAKNIPLAIVGNWDNSEYGQYLKKSYADDPFIYLIDPIYESGKLDQLRSNTALYVHGHSAGGTNPSLVEAMILGVPIFAFDVSFNRYTTQNLCQYFADSSQLESMLKSPDWALLKKSGDDLKKYAKSNYSWLAIGKKYKNMFNQVLGESNDKSA